jgi:hypothetical protein
VQHRQLVRVQGAGVLDQRRLHRPGLLRCGVGQPSIVRQIRAACRSEIAPSATAAATCGYRAGNDSPDIARRGPSSAASRTRPAASRRPIRSRSDSSTAVDAQPTSAAHSPRLQLGHQRVPDRGPLPNVGLQHRHQLQQLITTQRGRINGAQRLPRRHQLSQRGPRL